MTDYERAIAEFTAKQAVTICPDAGSVKEYRSMRKERFLVQRTKENEELQNRMQNKRGRK